MTGLKHWRGALTMLLAASLLVVGNPASAFVAADQNGTFEILLPEYNFLGHSDFRSDIGSMNAEGELATRYGGLWSVFAWNSQSDTPRHVYGTSVQLTGAITNASQLETAARQVIADNASVLRADGDNLRLHATPHALGKWTAHFQQTYHGIDVWEAKVRVLFTDTGKLMLMGSDYYSGIDVDPNPGLSASMAEAIAVGDLPFNPATDLVEGDPELLVLPFPISESAVEHHLVWRTRVRTEDPLGIWVTHVEAHSGEILWRYNDIHFVDVAGDTDTDVQIYGWCDGNTNMTIPYLEIDVLGGGTSVSDEDGNWTISHGGTADVTVECDLRGPYVDLNNQGGAEAFFSGSATPGVPFTVDFDGTNAQKDERDVFDAVNDIHDFFQLFATEFALPHARMTANVSLNSTCNAYWDGTINFYQEGGGCANTGELQQVVHHEFGHGVQAAILGSQGGEGLGEGNGDIIGNLITQDPIIGRGFYLGNCVSGIRNSDNNLSYPGDVIGQEIHYAGQVIAGFNWDSMIMLQDMYDTGAPAWDSPGTIMSAERWHYGRVLGHPTTQPDQVLWTFIADDDNGDLNDGTPHHAIFCEAANNHGFDCPEILVGVFVDHESHPYSGDFIGGYDAVGTAVSMPVGNSEIVPGSVTLSYRVNGGGFSTISMTATGNPDEYTGHIPAQSDGSVVEYYLYAEDTLGENGSSPADAPTSLHYFQVNDIFPDEMEFDTAWHTGSMMEETAGTGRWERADPEPTEAQPGDDHTAAPGTDCWVTGPLAGTSMGTYDVDAGQTVLYSPTFDLVGAADVSVSYWRWYSNDQGNAPLADDWIVQISNDNGDNWTDVENIGTSPNAWEQIAFDLDSYFATPGIVKMRFIASDLDEGSIVEACVDDFILMGVFDLTDVDDGIDVEFVTHLGQNHPNPFNPKTEIRFSLSQSGLTSLKIYDAQGRLVKTLVDGVLQAGDSEVIWNGDDAKGVSVASGVYFYKLETPGKTVSKRMVLLK
jgi:hypothetical protein